MGKTKHLKTFIENTVKEITARTPFYMEAHQCEPPYIVYAIENIRPGDKNSMVLEFNLWDKGSYDEVDEIGDLLENKLNRFTYIDDHMHIALYASSNRIVEDPDKRIKRRRLTFDLFLYERSND